MRGDFTFIIDFSSEGLRAEGTDMDHTVSPPTISRGHLVVPLAFLGEWCSLSTVFMAPFTSSVLCFYGGISRVGFFLFILRWSQCASWGESFVSLGNSGKISAVLLLTFASTYLMLDFLTPVSKPHTLAHVCLLVFFFYHHILSEFLHLPLSFSSCIFCLICYLTCTLSSSFQWS